MKIFTRYVIKQFALFTSASLLLFIFILLMDKVFQLAELVINKGVALGAVMTLLMYSLPTILVLAMPMASVAGVILTFGKMASDGEITAIRSSGNTLKPVVAPVLTAAFLIGVLMVPFNYYAAPASQHEFRRHFINIASQDPTLQIEENTLIDIPPYTLLCFEVDRENSLLGEVVIFKEEHKEEPAVSITARTGRWSVQPDGSFALTLNDGSIKYQDTSEHRKFNSIIFEEHSLILQAPRGFTEAGKNIETMTAPEMKAEIRSLRDRDLPTHRLEARYHLRSALAGAIPILLITGIPFGIRAEKKGKTIGIGLSIFVIASYYFLMVTGLKLAFNETLPPFTGAWLGNIVTSVFGTVMLVRAYYK